MFDMSPSWSRSLAILLPKFACTLIDSSGGLAPPSRMVPNRVELIGRNGFEVSLLAPSEPQFGSLLASLSVAEGRSNNLLI